MQAKSSTGLTAEFEYVTPVVATEWLLENNKMNRDFRTKRTALYSDEMDAGEWMETGIPVIFDTENQIADGQHRLAAIVESGVPQELLVVRNAQPNVRAAIDDNIRRLFSDDLKMHGETAALTRGAILRSILVWDEQGGLEKLTKTTFSRRHMDVRWPVYAKEIRDTEIETRRWNVKWALVGNSGAMRFMYWLLVHRVQCDKRAVDRFFSILAIGSQAPEDEILIKCRNWMQNSIQISPRGNKSYGPMYVQVYHLIRAWNAWLGGDTIGFNTPKGGYSNPYPMPIPAIAEKVK